MSDLGDRRTYLGASDMGKIMNGAWYDLWRQKTGREEPPDFSDNLAVQLGINTEALNIAWFCKQTGARLDPYAPQEWTHKEHAFLKCHPDAVLLNRELVEAKFTGAFVKEDEIVPRYYPQCQAQMTIIGAPACHLSIIWGTPAWRSFRIEADAEYQAELVKRACQFWRYVETDTPPPDQPAVEAKISLDDMREVSMEGHNEWASLAADWIETKAAAKKFEAAQKGIKSLVEPDVKRAFGHSIEARRSKNGAITIKECEA
jgi:predicted phage-related endonuclease